MKQRQMTSSEWHGAVRQALAQVDCRLASGELDGSGRFYTGKELAAGAATGKPAKNAEAPAA
jgi:hypothetical protein